MSAESLAPGVRDGQNVAEVHERLRREILAGRIPAGEVSQAALARRLDAGRTPLREALRLLQREGLVISEPNRRVRVAELAAPDVEELTIMRVPLEVMALRLTVPRLGSSGVADLEGLMAQMDHYRKRRDHEGYAGAHRLFHARLVGAAGSRVTRILAELYDHAERYRVVFGVATPEVWDRRQREHREIVDAIAGDDLELAVSKLVEHYGYAAALIFASLDDHYDPERLRTVLTATAPGSEHSIDRIEHTSDH